MTKSLADYDYKNTDEYKFHLKALENFRKLSLKEKLQTMVDAGILDENGKLTERYRPLSDPSSDT